MNFFRQICQSCTDLQGLNLSLFEPAICEKTISILNGIHLMWTGPNVVDRDNRLPNKSCFTFTAIFTKEVQDRRMVDGWV